MCKEYNNVVVFLKFEIKTLLFFSKVTHNLNTRTQEAEAGGFLWLWGQSQNSTECISGQLEQHSEILQHTHMHT